MSPDREKLIRVMESLDADFRAGKISEDKYRYFYSKYADKLNAMNASNRIRTMQGKKSKPNTYSSKRTRAEDNRREEQKLVQKYIVDPKKGDESKKRNNSSMDSGISKVIIVLILAIAFTAGIAFGVFGFDFNDMSVVNAAAIVEDSAFPDVEIVNITTNTNTTSDTSSSNYDTSPSDSTDNMEGPSQSDSGSSSGEGGGSSSGEEGSGSSGGPNVPITYNM